MIVDCHVHVWRYPEHFPNKKGMIRSQPARRKNWTDEQWKKMWDNPIENYFAESSRIAKALLVGIHSHEALGMYTANDYVKSVVDQYPDKLDWACVILPTEPEAVEEVERCYELGCVALGECAPGYGMYYANDPRAYKVWAKAQELELPVIIHGGFSQPTPLRMKYCDLNAIDDMAMDFPDLKIVLCHLGYPEYEMASNLIHKHSNLFGGVEWLTMLGNLDRRVQIKYLPQVDYAWYTHFLYPILYHLSGNFGDTDDLIFGTDWSASGGDRSVEIFENINELTKKHNLPEIPDEIIHKLLHENWKKVFTKIKVK